MDQLYITGTVDTNGEFFPGWWSNPPVDAVPVLQVRSRSRSGWEAVALDDAGDVLARAAASLLTVPICPGGSRLELSAVLDVPDATSSVAILERGREVYRRAVPTTSRVGLARQRDTTLPRRPIEIPIRIDGPAPRAGAYVVTILEAPDQPMQPVELIDVGAGQPAVVHLDLSELPGGDACRVWVMYCDGIRTVMAAERLSVEPRPPVPVILAPAAELELYDDTWLSLEGRLDGDGDPRALEWLLDGELVGTGTRAGIIAPPVGPHTVTLRYRAAGTSVRIVAVPAPTEERPLPWAPPWRSMPFRTANAPRRPV
jgi:hypothetical protein